jgi:hypothetical protein
VTIGEAAQLLTALAAVGSCIASLRNARKIDASAVQVQKIELATNSMKDALVKATAAASHAAGVVEGRKEANDAR